MHPPNPIFLIVVFSKIFWLFLDFKVFLSYNDTMTNEITLTDQNFDQEVLSSDKPFLVDFWAEWCGPCKMVSPAVSQIADEFAGELKVGKLNVDQNPQATMKYQILSIPSLKVFKSGKIIGEIVGAAPKPVIEKKIKDIIGLS